MKTSAAMGFPRDWKTKGAIQLSDISASSLEFLDRLWAELQGYDLDAIGLSIEPYPDIEDYADLLIEVNPRDASVCGLSICRFHDRSNLNWITVDCFERLETHSRLKNQRLFSGSILFAIEKNPADDSIALEIVNAVAFGLVELHVNMIGPYIVNTTGHVFTDRHSFDFDGRGSPVLAKILRKFGVTKSISAKYSPWPLAD